MRRNLLAIVIALSLPATAILADVKFTQLSDDQFIVHHRKHTTLGAEAKAMKTAVAEAASICVAAGFTHMELKDQNVGERDHTGFWGGGRGASADLRVKFFTEPDEDKIDEKDLFECKPLADDKKVAVAKRKLASGDG